MAAQDLQVTLKFLEWQELYEVEKPFQIFINIPNDAEDRRDTNLVFKSVVLQVHDIRESSKDFSLDENGFMYRQHTTKTTSFTDRRTVDQNYLPEIEALLRRELDGVDRVFFFDWRVCNWSILGPFVTARLMVQ